MEDFLMKVLFVCLVILAVLATVMLFAMVWMLFTHPECL